MVNIRVVPECSHTSISDGPSRDTVSSIGINSLRNLPSANTCDHIRYFRQALALDELRVKFLPEYVCGGMAERSKLKPGLPPSHEHVKEVWFAGNHSDMYVPLAPGWNLLITCSSGGARRGKAVSHLTLQDMPLLWMCEEVLAAGLLLNNSNIDFAYEDWRGHNIKSSLNVAWWLLEVLPIMHRRHGDNNQYATLNGNVTLSDFHVQHNFTTSWKRPCHLSWSKAPCVGSISFQLPTKSSFLEKFHAMA